MSDHKKAAPATPAASGKKKWVVIIVFVIASVGGGLFAPRFFAAPDPAVARAKEEADAKETFVPFGEVMVNLAEGRLSRYLRVKLVLSVESRNKHLVSEAVDSKKAGNCSITLGLAARALTVWRSVVTPGSRRSDASRFNREGRFLRRLLPDQFG